MDYADEIAMATREKESIQVRLAVPEDAAAIASVLQQAFAEYAHLYTPEAFAVTTPTAEQLLRRWNEGPVWVSVQPGDRIVGTVAVMPMDESLYVRSMALLPTNRGQGTGRLLLEEVERFARPKGYRRLVLNTTPFLSDFTCSSASSAARTGPPTYLALRYSPW